MRHSKSPDSKKKKDKDRTSKSPEKKSESSKDKKSRKRGSHSRSKSRSRSRRNTRQPRAGEIEPCKLYVGNLNFRTKDRDLEDMFGKYGKIKDVYIPIDQDSGSSRGFAFITFHDERDADDAVDAMDDREIDGRPLKVNKARARPPVYDQRGTRGRSRERGNKAKALVCRDYERGNCERGSRCRFSHKSRSRSRRSKSK